VSMEDATITTVLGRKDSVRLGCMASVGNGEGRRCLFWSVAAMRACAGVRVKVRSARQIGENDMHEQAKRIDTGTDELLCELRERVAIITLNRPAARNALSDHLSPALRRMIRHCADDDAIGALLLTGAGTAFCAGGDVK